MFLRCLGRGEHQERVSHRKLVDEVVREDQKNLAAGSGKPPRKKEEKYRSTLWQPLFCIHVDN